MVGRVGRLAGGWLGGWVAVVSCVGKCFRACGRWRCYCLWYLWYSSSILFSPRYNRPALAKFEYETEHPFAAVLLRHGGWVGQWVDGLVGGWVCRAVRACVVRYVGGVFVGDMEAQIVLVRLLGLCVSSFPSCRTLMLRGSFVLFENQVALKSASN